MPMHDWSRVDANIYHHFHQFWTAEICRSLNSGILPSGFSALIEQHAGSPIPDVLAVERRITGKKSAKPTGGTLLRTPPKTRHIAKNEKAILAAKGNQIVIHHRLGKVVCVIEVVSPGNKHGKLSFQQFVEKAIAFIHYGVHLLIIDPFPPTKRDPNGIHNAIWENLDENPLAFEIEKPLTLVAFAAGNTFVGLETMAYFEPIGVGDALPDMPVYLEYGEYVLVPLESTYLAAWANCPADMRELVETGKLEGE